jgi:hypothetical protein
MHSKKINVLQNGLHTVSKVVFIALFLQEPALLAQLHQFLLPLVSTIFL